jgi:LemA protein
MNLIPKLMEMIKGYAAHEKNTLDAVIKVRTASMQTTENIGIKPNLKLKANENFLKLQRELADTENKIQTSWRFCNSNVLTVNMKLKLFPSNIRWCIGFYKA